VISNLGNFTTNGGAFALSDAATLKVTGIVNSGAGTLSLTTTGTGHNINIVKEIETTGTIDLVSAAKDLEASSGAIVANKLNVTAVTGIDLTSALNNIAQLGTDTTTSGPNHVNL